MTDQNDVPVESEEVIGWTDTDSFSGFQSIVVLLFHFKQEGIYRVRIKEPQYIQFLIYGREAGQVYLDENFVGQGKSPFGAYRGLHTLMEDEFVKYHWEDVVRVTPEDKKKDLNTTYSFIMERIQSGKSGIRDF